VGGSIAHADPAAELPAVAVALGARFRVQNRSGERWIAAADFFTGLFSTELRPDELLVEIAVPESPRLTGWAFLEVARRHGDYALVGVAARVALARRPRRSPAGRSTRRRWTRRPRSRVSGTSIPTATFTPARRSSAI
jgi:carbon-monoxide dehydrogenase medium subunit